MTVKTKLEEIVGKKNVFDSPEILSHYSKDYSLNLPKMPNYVVKVKNTKEVQEIVKLANKEKMPVIPSSSAVHFYGSTIPHQGGIVVDLTGMNKVLEIDELNRKTMVEPGVTWQQLQTELSKRGYMAMMPLLPHPLRSVVTDYLEREAPVVSRYEYAEPLMSMEVVWPNGDIFRTGSASAPNFPKSFAEGANPLGPGTLDFFRFLQGAQGTMGIVTWANIKIEHLSQVNKVFFIPFKELSDAIEPLYRIQRLKIGHECLLLDSLNLALILAEGSPRDWGVLRSLSPWTLILILSGAPRRAEEKIGYEEKALKELGKEFPSMEILSSLPQFAGVERKLPYMLRQPWPKKETFWKHRLKGGCQALFFIAKPEAVPGFFDTVSDIAYKYDCAADEMGVYIQPIEDARACHCEFDFYYNPDIAEEKEKIRRLYAEAAQILLNKDALFTRPYGDVANLVYEKATSYTRALRQVKSIFDPNNIMCPGNLCF